MRHLVEQKHRAHQADVKLAQLSEPIKRAVRSVAPEAEIVLYGSRARGDATPESDWDLLVLVDGPVTREREQSIRRRLWELEWDSDEVLTSIIHDRQVWDSALYRAMPLHRNVDRDGIRL